MKKIALMMMFAFLFVSVKLAGAAAFSTISNSIEVSADVQARCSNVSTVPLYFGYYEELERQSLNAISVTCTPGLAFKIAVGPGLYSDGTNRRIRAVDAAGNESFLLYAFYRDSAIGAVWGTDCTLQVETFPHGCVLSNGTGAVQIFTGLGAIPAGQSVPVGRYTDTLTVTVLF